jgi:hypothetical protein
MKRGLLLILLAGFAWIASAEDWCVQHQDGGWWEFSKYWHECHANVSREGAEVWYDSYLDPNYGWAYQENDFWAFNVLRVVNTSKAAIKNVWFDPWIPYESDFYPVSEWSIWSYEGDYPELDCSPPGYNYCKSCLTECTTYHKYLGGWMEKPEWKDEVVTFSGAIDSRFVDQYYYQGVTGPRGGYYQAQYIWDLTALGTWYPSDMKGIKWLLTSTPFVRPGTYVLEWTTHIHYEVEPLIPECSFTFKKWCNPKSEEGKEHTKGTLMCWREIVGTEDERYQEISIEDGFPDGFIGPGYKEVKVWKVEGEEKEKLKWDEYELEIGEEELTLVLSDVELSSTKGILIKYPIRYDKDEDLHAYITTTFIRATLEDGSICESTYVTNLIKKD